MAHYLVTGGAGFIGRRLCRDLTEAGHSVRIIDLLLPQVHGDGDADDLPSQAELIRGDVRDKDAIARALDGVDAVFHLAAEVGVGQSMYEIDRYVSANDLGVATLLQAMIDRPVRRIVVASSMSVYGEGRYVARDGAALDAVRRDPVRLRRGQWNPVAADGSPLGDMPTDETKPVDLASIYALTKFVQERAVLLFGAAYGVEAVALRLFNVFGPGQALSNPYTGVLANFASRLMNDEPPLVFEDGLQRRDFVHVDDVARAFRLAMSRPDIDGEVFNIGSGRPYAIRDVAGMLAKAMGKAIEPRILAKARAGDIRNCYADISKARRLLGYEPRRFLETSLDDFVSWISQEAARDDSEIMQRELEARGLVA